ncbi:MAG: hypothetical protein ABIP65_10690 [Vicinamibacterales bacterium]
MTLHRFYRFSVWLPIVIPALVAGVVHGIGVAPGSGALQDVVEILLASLVWGGVPFALLALWGTWWIGDRPEPEIRRLMLRTPLIMVAVFAAFVMLAGVAVQAPVTPFLAVIVLGSLVIIPLGYGYVAVVLLVRDEWCPKLTTRV